MLLLCTLLACRVTEPPVQPATNAPSTLSWPDQGLLLDHVNLLDAEGPRTDRAILVSGDRILSILDAGTPVPDGIVAIDLAEAWVIPGLVDAHVHLTHSGSLDWPGPTVTENLRAQLGWGVVGVGDMGSPDWIFGLRDRISRGEVLGPRVFATGPFLTTEGSHPCEVSLDPNLCVFVDGDGAERSVELQTSGADGLKVGFASAGIDQDYPRLSTADLGDILQSPLPVWVHVASAVDARDAHALGARNLAHLPFDDAMSPDDFAKEWTAIHSTISANAGLVRLSGGEDYAGPGYRFLPAEVRNRWQAVQNNPEIWLDPGWTAAAETWTVQARANLSLAIAEQAPIVAGSDAGYFFVAHGFGLHQELMAMVEAGMTPQQAIVAGSQGSAEALGWTDLGQIAPGFEASLLVLDGDPRDDITQSQHIAKILLRGAWTSPNDLISDDIRLSSGSGPCLIDDDCDTGQRCDAFDQVCAISCDVPGESVGACGPESWCMANDGLSSMMGLCHVEPGCDLYAQDCAPASYRQACVPADGDSNVCRTSGPRQALETCIAGNALTACAPGLLCNEALGRCLALCDPAAPSCASGSCQLELADGSPWFGLCY